MGIVAKQPPPLVMSSGASTGTMTQQQPQAALQNNNGSGPKKVALSGGGGSSGAPTPVSTPIQNGQGPSPPPLTNAPKYGTLVPNRIFVGGISASTTEGELMQLFSSYGTVKAAKIIQDRAGVSKGYGFITFESEDDARRPLRDQDNIVLRERRLNIAPAIKKQPFGRPPAAPPYDGQQVDGRSSAPAQHQAALQPPMPPFFFPGAPPFYPGAAYYAPPVPMVSTAAQAQVQVSQAGQEQQQVYQAPPLYQAQTGPPQAGPYTSMMFTTQPIYMSQQYPTQVIPYDYMYSAGGPGGGNGVAGGGIQSNYIAGPSSSNGAASPPRTACYAASAPPEFVYGHPPHHIFHPATLDPTGGGPIYTDATFDPMAQHAMGHFGAIAPYGLSEDGSIEHPSNSDTPRSYLTATPPSIEPSYQRSTATPVVSVLSLDNHQERDAASMQGGRRPNAQASGLPRPHLQLNHAHYQNGRRGGYHNGGGYARRPPPLMGGRSYMHNNHMQMAPPPSYVPQPQMRGRRKQSRRTAGTGTSNEIGAGDAPLPHEDLAGQMEVLRI